ncbi:DgyrCDS14308 [Dimorphilus gyrociliatus]|uniref:DgyrCDS14308 n=1 Tax=Dimorphilus gyrociliatus TaxID=2664684 RepID=A0A7I8WD73_9ANNE|nr:DgyrCDS14308 [Dimorphilus gyrociliatus]
MAAPISSPREKFEAAVNVIHSLPKNVSQMAGSFQPSHSMMLMFYGYYKQATEGKCTKAKPAFYDVINKAKWEAWHKLGDMPEEEAMTKYVEELKKIIEAMPHTNMVSEFVEKLGNFYEIVDENGSTIGTKEAKNLAIKGKRLAKRTKSVDSLSNGLENGNGSALNGHGHIRNGNSNSDGDDGDDDDDDDDEGDDYNKNKDKIKTDANDVPKKPDYKPRRNTSNVGSDGESLSSPATSDDEFCDTSQEPIVDNKVLNSNGPFDLISARGGENAQTNEQVRQPSGESLSASQAQRMWLNEQPSANQALLYSSSGGRPPNYPQNSPNSPYAQEVNERIAIALVRLQQDMNSVLTRLNTLETLSLTRQPRSRRSSEKNLYFTRKEENRINQTIEVNDSCK